MKKFRDHLQEQLKDPEFKAAFEAIEPEYRLAKRMIEARISQKLTQEELAKKAGVTQNTITRLESGSTNPTFATINRVAAALGKELILA